MNEREQEKLENQKAIDEYLANGGEVTVLEAGLRSDPELLVSPWNKRKATPNK
jgi:hypothetical protein